MSVVERLEPAESCLRCRATMHWRHQTWQCSRCGFKLGCCEGEAGDCATEPALRERAASPTAAQR